MGSKGWRSRGIGIGVVGEGTEGEISKRRGIGERKYGRGKFELLNQRLNSLQISYKFLGNKNKFFKSFYYTINF